ncbi:MAG: hypothetical protein ABSH36_02565 [Solirubrobacteraceae bacterium]
MSSLPNDPAAGRQVAVTVTTIRVEQEDGVRQSTARGDFDRAVREALSARLAPWAVDQVLGSVLERRPRAGLAIEYEGSFSAERHLRITVQPTEATEDSPPCRPRRIPGLFLPRPSETIPVHTGGDPS